MELDDIETVPNVPICVGSNCGQDDLDVIKDMREILFGNKFFGLL
jgi:hypothetical protein